MTIPHIAKIDAYYTRLLRRVVGVKASFYCRALNTEVYNRASRPKLPSQTPSDMQFRMMHEVFNSSRSEAHQPVAFNTAHKDRIFNQGRRRGMQFPYWVEVMTKQYFPTFGSHQTTPLSRKVGTKQ